MSTGLYTHRTRNAGEIVTAPLYNGAHQNQLQNDIPTSAGAHSDDITMFDATTDPMPASVPTPVISLALELEQYRFVIANIKEFINGSPPTEWYYPITANATSVQARGARINRTTNQTITIATPTVITFDNVRYDTGVAGGDDFFDGGAPTRLTIPVAGVYHIIGFGAWAAANGNVALLIRANGLFYIGTIDALADTSGTAIQEEVSASYAFNVGDWVELIALQTAAATLDIVTPEFGIELIGALDVVPMPGTFNMLITEDGTGTGVVTADSGAINCPGVCTDDYVAATVVMLTATPDMGAVFAGWSGDVPGGDEMDNPLSITMNADKVINATFALGSVTASFSGGAVVASGTIYSTFTTMMIGGATIAPLQIMNVGARVVRRITVVMTAALGGGQQVTVQLNVNGVDQAGIIVTLVAADQFESADGAVTIADGDLVVLKYVQSGGGSNAVQSVTLLSTY